MSIFKVTAVAVALTSGLLTSALAQAHSKLLSSTPAEGESATAPAKIELHFSENLIITYSKAELIMIDAPMFHSPVVKATVASGSDPKTMIITPASTLPSGAYRVEYHAGTHDDRSTIHGNFTFKVK
ncbi:copper resistance protein CopC [Pseudomonas sp. G5(2012)]|jgi:methionine-rich copper-binding protein CopC|uniref:copper resistance protein CopC n=1 Tax=Pseudomonas sp. G5(2012) TaxID=1268068 RepID=UPI0003A6DE19|nr:copper resistance protein CopC [Pseudomonas sp. G5(2012)]